MRYALLSLSEQFTSSRTSINRLTWSDQSFPIQIDSISMEGEFTTDNIVRIDCTSPQNSQSSTSSSFTPISISVGVHGRSLGPTDLAKIWARQAILGETMEAMGVDGSVASMALSLSALSTIPLSGILQANNATGWLAEGLTRLYMVEEF